MIFLKKRYNYFKKKRLIINQHIRMISEVH